MSGASHGERHYRIQRVNYRAEMLNMRRLLETACRVIDTYFPETGVMPERLQVWWDHRRKTAIRTRIELSERGVAAREIQVITSEEELRDDCC